MASEAQGLGGLVERLRKPTDSDGIYDHYIKLRSQTKSDLPRMALCNEFDLLDEERTKAADAILTLCRENERLREAGTALYDALGVAVHQRVDPIAAQLARGSWHAALAASQPAVSETPSSSPTPQGAGT